MFKQSKSKGSSNSSQVENLLDPAYATVHRTMIDAAPDCILLVDLQGTVILMNKAARQAAALEPHESDIRPWFDFSPPESLEECRRNFAIAVSGEATRFPLTTTIAGKTTYWDIVFSPVRNPDGQIAFIMSIGRDVTTNHFLDLALAQAAAREKLVTREMQHRIKNLFSVVNVLITMAEREAKASATPQELVPLLKSKMAALSRASEATYLRTSIAADLLPNENETTVDVTRLVGAVLAPYASMVTLKGSSLATSRKNITTLTLFLHELATNSVKYGALSQELGHIDLNWSQENGLLHMVWTETGGPEITQAPTNHGFGSTMIDRLISLADGSIERSWPREGLITRLVLPI